MAAFTFFAKIVCSPSLIVADCTCVNLGRIFDNDDDDEDDLEDEDEKADDEADDEAEDEAEDEEDVDLPCMSISVPK